MAQLSITQIRHPEYRHYSMDWKKYRLAYEGGRPFVDTYLERYSKREDQDEFRVRKRLTYCPRFAGAAIDDVKNSIYQRMVDITRVDGDDTYQRAVMGLDGGVDLDGSNMNRFLGQLVLPELLIMGKVGVYIDMPRIEGETLLDLYGKKPYLYYYCAEDICSWTGVYTESRFQYTSLLLRDTELTYDDATDLPLGEDVAWRFYKLTNEGVVVTFYDKKGAVKETVTFPDMKRIPFILLQINKSLIEDIADYQIALMNLESTDIDYMRRSNFPFYVEQYDHRAELVNFKRGPEVVEDDPVLKRNEVVTGASSGRQYPLGANAPEFIHPSSEPLLASMQKEQQLKNDIRKLLNLSLSNLEPKFASAESKGMDDRSLESGLSAIGLVLQHGESQIAEVWSQYLKTPAASITYPRSYSLKSEGERREEAKSDSELMQAVPSVTYQKTLAVKIAKTMVGHLVSEDELQKIQKEIQDAPFMSSDVEAITKDLQNGLVGDETASKARGYADGEVAKAKVDRAERIKITQMAQTSADGSLKNPAARGVGDLGGGKGNANPDNTNRGAASGKAGE